MLEGQFPILEFDEDQDAYINPSSIHQRMDISERAVLCFFAEAIETLKNEIPFRVVYTLRSESTFYPVYEFDDHGNPMVVVHMPVGAPVAAGMVEELHALGCNKFIACGGCGVLADGLPVGHLLIPVSAVRDEGTSYHYAKPSREMMADGYALQRIEETLTNQGIPYRKVKTWTTDAFFRETKGKIQKRKDEGCACVEMEAAAFMAVAQFRKVVFGQILYSGDDLSGDAWDVRDWHKREDIRAFVLKIAMDCCLAL